MKAWRLLGEIFSRSGFARSMGKTFGGDRDLWPTLGYRDNPDVRTYLSWYQRGDIAAQIVDLPPDTTWRYAPELRLAEDSEEQGTNAESFIKEVGQLDDRVGLWRKMKEVDRLSGIGRFGVLLIGFRGTTQLQEEAPRIQSLKDILFLTAYHENNVEINTWVEDESSERFGKPETYKIEMSRGEGNSTKTVVVHWTRVLHVLENPVDDEVYGTPRLERVINRLDDLQKVVGGAAEIFWLAIAGVLHADIDPEVDLDPDDEENFEKDLVEVMHGLRRIVQTRGVTLNRLAASGNVDPEPSFEAVMQLISGTTRIPNRVLLGSERGELASSQDQKQWHASMAARQVNHAEPVIIRPFFQRLESLGVKQPQGMEVFWPPLDEPTEVEVAEIAAKKAEAAVKLAPGGQADLLVKPWEARELLGYTPVPGEPPEGAAEAFGEDVGDGEDDLDLGREESDEQVA